MSDGARALEGFGFAMESLNEEAILANAQRVQENIACEAESAEFMVELTKNEKNPLTRCEDWEKRISE